jgi:hypothetical protein
VRRLRPDILPKRTIWCITKTHRFTLLSQWNFLTKKQYNCCPHLFYFSLFPRLKTKLKCRYFDTTEELEAELQAVLNRTEYDFQDALKNGRSAGNGLYARKGTTSRG